MISVTCPTCGATEPLPDSVGNTDYGVCRKCASLFVVTVDAAHLTPLDLSTVSEIERKVLTRLSEAVAIAGAKGQA